MTDFDTSSGGCSSCGGGDNNLHFLNDDPTVDEIVQDGNIVYHPKPARPDDWCVHQLRNVTKYTQDYDGLQPMVWDADRCLMAPGVWPCPQPREWSSEFATAPPSEECIDCSDGVWQIWVDTTVDVATHVCVDGNLIELGGAGGGGGGGCCTQWQMANENCEPVLVVYSTASGWSFYNEDLVSIPRPSTLQPVDYCAEEPCPVTRVDNGDGTMTITDCHGSYVVQLKQHRVCCWRVTDSNGDVILVEATPYAVSTVNVTAGGSGFAAPLTWPDTVSECCYGQVLCTLPGEPRLVTYGPSGSTVYNAETLTVTTEDPASLLACDRETVDCAAVDVLTTDLFIPGDDYVIDALGNDTYPAGASIAIVAGSEQNVVAAAVNGDNTVTITPGGVDCRWAVQYELSCPDGFGGFVTSTAWLYGNVDALLLGDNVVNNPNFVAAQSGPVAAGGDIGGGWSSSVDYVGLNTYPPDTSVSIQSGHQVFPQGADQVPFPGDPVYDVPATDGWLYSNGNTTGGAYISAQQTINIEPGRTYEFHAYTSSAVSPTYGSNPPDDSVLQFTVDGVAFGPGFVELDHQDPASPDNGEDLWHRRAWTWTAPGVLGDPPTTVVFALENTATGAVGNDLALTAISFAPVEPCDHYQAGDPIGGP